MTSVLLLHVPMVFLQAAHFKSSEVVLVHEAFDGGGEGGDGRGDGDAGHDGLGAHLDFIDHGFGAIFGGVHDPLDFLVVDEVQQVRAATGDAEHGAGLDAFVVEHGGGAAGGIDVVAHIHEMLDERDADGLGNERHGARGADDAVAYGRSRTIYVRSGYILGAIGGACACRAPPRTKPRYASLGPKGSLSLTRML